ncbi:PLC-like phosphodiesterase [Clavulina sp. PMI_390]|nr:PLC-like phosphodiesterase [Clavulina sp. PMI_390]
MANRAVTIGPKKLREIAIPGSHLSGTYAVSPLKPWQTGRYLPRVLYLVWELRLPRKIEEIVLTMWTLAQPDNFLTQLNAGIRYFDLQIQGVVNGAPMCFVYGLESAPVTELFSQLSAFLSTKGNEKEVVLLNFSYTYDMTWSDTVDLLNSFVNTFSDSLAVYNPNGSNKGGLDGFNLDAKLNELWATSARVIIFYSNPDALEKYNFLWPRRSTISSSYPEEATFADVKAVLDNLLPFKEDLFFVLQCQVTPDLDVIKSGVAGSYASLGALAQAGNPLIVKWLNGWGPHKGINIVLADWMTLYPELVSTVIGLNDHTSSVNALVGTNSDTEMEQAREFLPPL